MIRFLLKGLLRDRSRSLFPILTVTAGVMATALGHSWFHGALGGMLTTTANFQTGYVKIMSRAYADLVEEMPNDLALVDVDALLDDLAEVHPGWQFTPRIHFGGLIDIPDENGETRSQGPTMGLAVDLLDPDAGEVERLKIRESIIRGRLPEKPDEILVAEELARKLEVEPGQVATIISSTMNGSMAFYNFRVAGTVNFGINMLDRGTIITDIRGARQALDMGDAAGEIVGFLPGDNYRDEAAQALADEFNARFSDSGDQFSPTMVTLADQNGMRYMLNISNSMGTILVTIFIVVMSLVLWNSGLMGSLRRYGEMGVRLAIGESQGHIYRSMLAESVMIGIMGSIIGTAIGVALGYWIQVNGIDIGSMMKESSIMMDNIIRTQVSATTYYIGFIPGVIATLIGTAFAGIGIYRRQTASLFKELEV
ncbi:MAG: FtsX-like permease family protein [Candidatus Marinimicrobia bacterium]|nr:FtsX-like permease family protein [Candidatus Neomarinimicrobiota bacterium]MCF7840878.1 FtsX-like permease family protein [Candidatus Neomarinimicrobiota bacterium]MCF7902822.1 FtsX-like permease family protein [Candidatus Neomarinimicrobiota bacterium]